ncbi:MAG: ATP-binding protein [Alphaproteobacteria bacterium]|nr:ATP-binding protein [Alphaproteobacteria bacterium]
MFSELADKWSAVRQASLAPREPLLRQVMPKSLFGRSLLIVLLPLLILQAVLAYVFYERHWDTVTRWLAVGIAGEISLLSDLVENAGSPETRKKALDLGREHFGFTITLEPGGRLEEVEIGEHAMISRLDQTLTKTFTKQVSHPFAIDTTLTSERPRQIAVFVELEHGLLRVVAPRKRVDSTTTRIFIGWMVGLSLLLLILAIYFLTRQLRPIRRLAWAADNFGKGRDVGDFELAGATEIRQAGAAFNTMRKRILRQLTQRTEMLAAVSHDLRTPLTRMKLELEMLKGTKPEPDDIKALQNDVEDMAKVVDGYLAFARGEGQESMAPTDLGNILHEVGSRVGRDDVTVDIELERPITMPLRPVAIRRCIANLIENAARYAGWIGIRATMEDDKVWIAIDDDGPGIPADQREAVFKPFFRLDASRNPGTGGVGLGLSIARDIVLSHGGDIQLLDAPAGGLRVLIRLPC